MIKSENHLFKKYSYLSHTEQWWQRSGFTRWHLSQYLMAKEKSSKIRFQCAVTHFDFWSLCKSKYYQLSPAEPPGKHFSMIRSSCKYRSILHLLAMLNPSEWTQKAQFLQSLLIILIRIFFPQALQLCKTTNQPTKPTKSSLDWKNFKDCSTI